MKVCVLCFLLLVACLYPSVAQGSYEDCCLKYGKQPNSATRMKAKGYRIQKTDGGCNMPAVIFVFRLKKNTLCADPKEPWVKSMMRKLNDLTVYH